MAEIFMHNVPFACDHHQLTRALAEVLHQPPFAAFSALPLNFSVHLFKDKRGSGRKHKGSGSLTLPRADLANLFLQVFGDERGSPTRAIYVPGTNRALRFKRSRNGVKADIVQNILRLPYQDPAAIQEQEQRTQELSGSSVAVSIIQFGWECRDDTFSIEWERQVAAAAAVTFSEENREMRVHIQHNNSTLSVVIRYSSINDASVYSSRTREPEHSVWMSLATAPHFERQDPFNQKRTRLQCLPFPGHREIVGFTSHAMRLVVPNQDELQKFRRLSEVAQMHQFRNYNVRVERRGLFSASNMEELNLWQRHFSWDVAYQIEGILRRLLVDVKEMLTLMTRIRAMIMRYNSRYTAAFLKVFRLRATNWWFQEDVEEEFLTIDSCFTQTQEEFTRNTPFDYFSRSTAVVDQNVVQGLHASVTPTSISLDGPFPEQNNRVLRSFPPAFHDNFLRVSFMEEGKTQFRFDRDIDGRAFIEDRVGTLLRQGLTIAGRKFDFLAYSMSALKEHTVWFLQPFTYRRNGANVDVTAASIIASLGTFDRTTLYCPARYAARISQAFTATDQATVDVEEIEYIRDIETPDGKYCFTDGVGTLSPELARKIWANLQATRKRARRSKGSPRAYQVRFQGSKGMLSVDHRLRGSVINLRPSMKKFDAPDNLYVEVARAFFEPGAYYLNRPLIMLLEGLGVAYEVFERYQDAAVADVERSTRDIAGAGKLFEKYGLGASFRVPSILNSLAKLGLDHLAGDEFYRKVLEFAVNHILRDLKNHARIPVPKGHTLVGVADVHGELKENEIYACIKRREGAAVWLEGPVLVSRSPTIHPGDAQIAQAIGRPKAGSSFAIEPLPNMVVFSTKGSRPLPTCLGGGDLDGDLYNLIPLNECPEFRPRELSRAASYDPVEKKMLDRPSTMNDVADFVVDYINSDVVGIIAINWLIIADQSDHNIFDPDCMTLSQLHSDAVDYQKSGTPVALDRIPRLKFKARPDWNAPETVNVNNSTTHYKSQRAIGKLFRKVELPTVNVAQEDRRQRRRMRRMQNLDVDDLVDELSDFTLSEAGDDPVLEAIRERVDEFIDVGVEPAPATREAVARLFQRYASDLQGICATQVLSHRRTSTLTEEEAVVGTIIEKTSQPRKRKETMAKLREHTDYLVKDIRTELAADEDAHEPREAALMRGWLAWQLSLREHELFGAKSFGWVALGSIFETIKDIEDEEKERLRNLGYD